MPYLTKSYTNWPSFVQLYPPGCARDYNTSINTPGAIIRVRTTGKLMVVILWAEYSGAAAPVNWDGEAAELLAVLGEDDDLAVLDLVGVVATREDVVGSVGLEILGIVSSGADDVVSGACVEVGAWGTDAETVGIGPV